MGDRLSALADFSRSTWAKVLAALTAVAVMLGVATEGVVLYGQSQAAAVRAEMARNADERQKAEKEIEAQKARIEKQTAENAPVYEQAKANKTKADAAVAQALAENAQKKQAAENKFAAQKAIVETAIAKYAERLKRAEANKQAAEARTAQEVARNSETKFKAEADRETLQALMTEHEANINQWITNCSQTRGNGLVSCASKWGCLADPTVLFCR